MTGFVGFEALLLVALYALFAALPAMAFVNEGKYTSDWLKMEERNHYCREVITILGGTGGAARELRTGMVVGKVTASGKYVQFDQDANGGADEGAEDAAGILICDANGEPAVVAPSATDIQAVVLVRGPAIVNANQITWPSDIDAGEKTAAVAQLEALGIRVREGA